MAAAAGDGDDGVVRICEELKRSLASVGLDEISNNPFYATRCVSVFSSRTAIARDMEYAVKVYEKNLVPNHSLWKGEELAFKAMRSGLLATRRILETVHLFQNEKQLVVVSRKMPATLANIPATRCVFVLLLVGRPTPVTLLMLRSDTKLHNVFRHIVEGGVDLYESKLMNRNVKLDNIYIDDNDNVFIGDHGTCAVIPDDGEVALTLINTLGYGTPEINSGDPYGAKVRNDRALSPI
jgi:serine/threonine protein kinase